jgi:hypothetical protein
MFDNTESCDRESTEIQQAKETALGFGIDFLPMD